MRLFNYIRKFEEFILSTSILVIALLTIINVFMRTFLEMSLASAEELTQFLIIMVTFVGTSYASGKARHIRMSAIYDQLPYVGKKFFLTLYSVLTCTILWILTYYALSYAHTLKTLGTKSPVLNTPFYWVYLLAPLGLFLSGLQYFLALIKNMTHEGLYLSFDEEDRIDKRVPAQAEEGLES